jgi:hypothetical protein
MPGDASADAGATPDSGDAGADAGETPDSGDAGLDAGGDAGGDDAGTGAAPVPTTTLYTDAGVIIVRYDYDAGTDCDGITPAPDDFAVAMASFPPQPKGCPPPLTDESGVIALGTGGAVPIGEYALLTNDLDGGYIAAFAPGIARESLHAEPIGFSGAALDGGWAFTLFGRDGAQLATCSRALGVGDTSDVSALPSGGYALVVGDAAASNYLLQTVTPANGWKLSVPIVLDSSDGGVMHVEARTSQEGNLIIQRRDYPTAPSFPNRWYAIDGTPLTDWFGGYSRYLAGKFTMLGGVVFDMPIYEDGGKPDYFWFAPDPTAKPAQPPDMNVQWAIVRNARAYANWGEICFWNGTCWRNPNQMDLLSRSGLKCASLFFDPHGNISVGRDGTVIQQNGCSYRWYPHVLR